ncbi:MAG TPA: single-stranded DNA-binding protein [Thermomicrobiales bacterium]|nr:single-stranded DNA-binding protein [Thermomicrobiales bacterium]
MPRGMNVIHLIGTIGSDAELRYTQGGTAVATFRLAVNRPPRASPPKTALGAGKPSLGDGQAVTDWFTIACWGKLAEVADEHVRKGGRVYVHGRLQPRAYTDRQGRGARLRACVDLEANAEAFLLLDGKPDAGDHGRRTADRGEEPLTLDDVPF